MTIIIFPTHLNYVLMQKLTIELEHNLAWTHFVANYQQLSFYTTAFLIQFFNIYIILYNSN